MVGALASRQLVFTEGRAHCIHHAEAAELSHATSMMILYIDRQTEDWKVVGRRQQTGMSPRPECLPWSLWSHGSPVRKQNCSYWAPRPWLCVQWFSLTLLT